MKKTKVVLSLAVLAAMVLFSCQQNSKPGGGEKPLNIAILTLDDMGYGTTGAEGCSVPEITPHIDRLASEGMMFTRGFVMTPICGPSRAAILSGRYPHCNGIMGHGEQPPPLWEQPEIVTPTITHILQDAGYTTGTILKNRRNHAFHVWDVDYDEAPFGVGYHDRNPDSFYKRAKQFITNSQASGKPFFLYANPIDPHRPWVDTEQEKQMLADWNPNRPYPDPDRRYSPEEVEVPHFLPDLPDIRKNLVPYYESLHRGDDCIGGMLRAIDESGEAGNTLVIFLSDHGMGAFGAKATLYHDGIRTPVIVRWPGKIKAGEVNDESIVSSIDIVPTILDAAGLPPLENIEGKSFYDVMTGKSARTEREYAYAASNYFNNSTQEHYFPHRAIIDREFCYIWNAYVIRPELKKPFFGGWMDIVRTSMDVDPEFARKADQIINKPAEEFFDLVNDPGCWNNLARDPAYAEKIKDYRKRLLHEMKSTADPELPFFNPEF
jgi:N-sulfoglucosamine sulfohydrolase